MGINSVKNIILKQKQNLVTNRNDYVEVVAKINKAIQTIKKFELELELEKNSKHLILKSIIIGKNTRNKQTPLQCINNDIKTKGKERVRL